MKQYKLETNITINVAEYSDLSDKQKNIVDNMLLDIYEPFDIEKYCTTNNLYRLPVCKMLKKLETLNVIDKRFDSYSGKRFFNGYWMSKYYLEINKI